MALKKLMISQKEEMVNELDSIIELINQNRIVGSLSRSRVISLALNEWIQKQMLIIYTTFKDKFKKIKPLKYIKDV